MSNQHPVNILSLLDGVIRDVKSEQGLDHDNDDIFAFAGSPLGGATTAEEANIFACECAGRLMRHLSDLNGNADAVLADLIGEYPRVPSYDMRLVLGIVLTRVASRVPAKKLIEVLPTVECDDIRERIAQALYDSTPGPTEVDGLIRLLASGSPPVCRIALKALSQVGPEARRAIPFVIFVMDRLEESNWQLITDACMAIGPASADELPNLVACLEHFTQRANLMPKPAILLAIRKIGGMGQAASTAVSVLLRLMGRTEDQSLKDAYAEAVRCIQPVSPHCVPDLIDLLSEIEPDDVRLAAAEALAQLGPAAAPAIPPLIAMLDGTEADRRAAAKALRAIGPAAKAALAKHRRLDSRHDMEIDAAEEPRLQGSEILKHLKVFYLIGKLYAEGATSQNQCSRILEKPSVKKPPDDDELKTSSAAITRSIEKVSAFIGERSGGQGSRLFENDKGGGKASRFTPDGEEAWRWTADFLRQRLGPNWWGFARRVTPDDR